MNTPSPDLDHFETALLAELRTHVAERSAPRRLPVGRLLAGAAAAALVGGAVVVTGLGGRATTSPAYAVEREADGDVVVTIARLEDADSLQADLRDAGIDATVSFDPQSEEGVVRYPFLPVDPAPVIARSGTYTLYFADEGPCRRDADPATLVATDEGFELRIPAGSPAQERPVIIQTATDASLTLAYPGDDAGSYCLARATS